jgi:hypothetical protein
MPLSASIGPLTLSSACMHPAEGRGNPRLPGLDLLPVCPQNKPIRPQQGTSQRVAPTGEPQYRAAQPHDSLRLHQRARTLLARPQVATQTHRDCAIVGACLARGQAPVGGWPPGFDDRQVGSKRLIMPDTCLGRAIVRRLACSGRGCLFSEKRKIDTCAQFSPPSTCSRIRFGRSWTYANTRPVDGASA